MRYKITEVYRKRVSNVHKPYNPDSNHSDTGKDQKMKTDTKSILDLAQKVIDIAKVVLVVEPKPKKKAKTKKGIKRL